VYPAHALAQFGSSSTPSRVISIFPDLRPLRRPLLSARGLCREQLEDAMNNIDRPRLITATSPDGLFEVRLPEGMRCSACDKPVRCFPIWLGPHSFKLICEACHRDVVSFGRAQ
jgi:hypothetical protein